ncbi:NUDIX domain-containing protein [Salipiger sp. P9]|uniref:NUDIX domain-containing protein n=1 Tax=Salipiger pentaromativorans TaxID=2943193 RepID=UPI0021586440|nr:NUDIX domain-containing protein [Salipiger pentaromativorans]MCR8547366.1 NUDIX domain-containing protein [Salipiger pentaromativorans]
MADLFVFGTLRHPPLLETVLGHAPRGVTARLPGYSVYRTEPKGVPGAALCETPGTAAEGLLLHGLTPKDLARVAFYLGGFRDGLREVTVLGPEARETPALAHVRGCPPADCGGLFDLADWVSEWGGLACGAAHEIMPQYGRVTPERMAALRPYLAARAWAQQLARQGAPHRLRSGMGRDAVEILRDNPGFEGFFRLRAFDLRHRRFDGSLSEIVSREGFVAYDAALVLPYDPETDRVLLIEQLRYGPVLRGDPLPWVLEPVAGLVDAGESPESCVLREALEEAGLTLRGLRPMVRVYASPGYSSEFFHCFLGLCTLSEADNGLGGLAEEHEDIRSHVLPFDEALALVDSGEVNAGPLAMMLYWLARHRDALRSGA